MKVHSYFITKIAGMRGNKSTCVYSLFLVKFLRGHCCHESVYVGSTFYFLYQVRGNGYSNIPSLTTSLSYPARTTEDEMLLYLFKVECTSANTNRRVRIMIS